MTNIRIYHEDSSKEDTYEIETKLMPIELSNRPGIEITLNIRTHLNTKEQFFSDTNGLDMLHRSIKDDSFLFGDSEPIAGNYYPVNPIIFICDENTQERAMYKIFSKKIDEGK